jgi:hypothetical protein
VSELTMAELVNLAIGLVGLATLAAAVVGPTSAAYRWYAHDRLPDGVGVLIGLAAVAALLNTTAALSSAIVDRNELVDPVTAAYTICVFAVAGIVADVSRRVGDRLATRTFDLTGGRDLGDVGRLVRAGGRVITVELPATVTDLEGYEPVPPETKQELEGATLVFPRGLTVADLRERLVARLRDDYGVGHVDLELADDGTISYLAVGRRAVGVGPTLPPGSVAVAVRADPAPSASPGDLVQVWTTDAELERLVTAELRAAVGDVATLSLDAADADLLDPAASYRLVTMPTEPRADREFASLLRAADETMGAVEVVADGPLDGRAVGDLDVTVVAVQGPDGADAIPGWDRVLAAGETVYVVAPPETFRRFESGGGAAGDGATAVDA